jgi:hypothetical protein
MLKRFLLTALLGATAALPISAPTASAATVQVSALQNSSSGGIGALAGVVNAGDAFSITVDPLDLWSAGPLPRWSNANGLTGPLLATGSDESGQAANTLIGQSFGTYTQGNLSAAFGTLVGRIGGGSYFVVGTSFNGTAASAGPLELFYWDSNFSDNSGLITATVNIGNTSVVPLPAAAWFFVAGSLGMVGVARRRKQAA